ncbi:MAG: hypothetical protein HY841_04265 [Bacteroidetes bacterium]|nr:hypothetical protein [Bacteroidota bacterium]
MSRLLVKDSIKTGILTLSILIFSFYYFDIYYWLFDFKPLSGIITKFLFSKFHLVLTGMMFLISFSIFLFLKKTKRYLIRLNTYFNLVFFMFLLFEIYKTATYKEFNPILQNKFKASEIQSHSDSIQQRNIYYIVLDSYTNSSSLKKYWNYDNDTLAGFLKSKGFFIAEKSHCNYNSTPFSIASSLNMSYLNIENYEQAQKVQISKAYDMVKNSATAEMLSAYGYEIKNLSLFDLKNIPAFYTDPFYRKTNLFDRTIFFLLTERLGITHEHRQLISLAEINPEIFMRLISVREKPSFCYAHVMMPHYPYFYDENGNRMSDEYACSEEGRKEKYLKQLKFANQQLMKTINYILSHSEVKPVIIIQGDHGFRDFAELGSEEQIKESKTIFNACLLPDDTLKNSAYDSISPVNSFRIVFNNYFGTKFSLLEDKSCNTEIKSE